MNQLSIIKITSKLRKMKRLSLLFGKLCLIALMALPVFTSCSDDEDNGKEPTIIHKYENGFYVINEGKMGSKGSICYYKNKQWFNNIYRTNNSGKTLGNTSTTATIYNNKMYVVSKESPYLTEINLEDFSHVAAIEGEELLGTNGQSNDFCIINDNTAILTSTNGAFKVNLNPLALGETIEGTGRTKDVYKSGNHVLIISDDKILSYNAIDLSFEKELTDAVTGFTQSKDGNIWAANMDKLIKIDPNTLTVSEIALPEGFSVNYNSMAYTPTCLCSSISENAIDFVKKDGWNSKEAYKYDIASGDLTKIVTAPDNYSFYGAGLSVDPKKGNVYATFTEDGWGDHYMNNQILVVNGKQETPIQTIDYSGEFWFPSKIIF